MWREPGRVSAVRRALLTVAFVALVLADLSFIPVAAILVTVGGVQGLIGVNGHGSGSRSALLLGAVVLIGAGVVIAAVLLWLTRLVLRLMRAA